jgi:hypothetical protein
VPTKRRKLTARPIGLSAAALEAWRRGDFHALARALAIGPWRAGWPRAQELQRALLAAAGEPPARLL